jgi:hypothetical protein
MINQNKIAILVCGLLTASPIFADCNDDLYLFGKKIQRYEVEWSGSWKIGFLNDITDLWLMTDQLKNIGAESLCQKQVDQLREDFDSFIESVQGLN